MHALLASAPALPLDEAGRYVAGAYVVFLVLLVVYVAIMAAKLQRMEKDLKDLAGIAESRSNGHGVAPGQDHVAASSASRPGAAEGGDA